MQHTAHQAIETRLNMWKVFFETGHDATPDDATDDEYGLDQLVDLAFESDSARLHDLASLVEIMGVNHIGQMNNQIFDALMQDGPAAVTDAELDAVLNG